MSALAAELPMEEALEASLLRQPLIEGVVTHHFAHGVYMRELLIPLGDEPWAVAVGHRHLTDHIAIVLAGRGLVSIDGAVREIKAGDVMNVRAGTRKTVLVVESMRFACLHPNPTNETDVETLESLFVEKSTTFLAMEHELAQLQRHMEALA